MEALPSYRLHESVAHWMHDPNVVGLDMRYKVVNGRETRDWAICVQVLKKKRMSALADGELHIPPIVRTAAADPGNASHGHLTPTDVIEVEQPMLLGSEGWYRRPAYGGLAIGINSLLNDNDTHYGTMTTVNWGGGATIISAAHVLNTGQAAGWPDRDTPTPAQPIFQPPEGMPVDPAKISWNPERMKIGVVENGYRLYHYPSDHKGPYYYNTYDAAWAILDPPDKRKDPKNGEMRMRPKADYRIGVPGPTAIWPQREQSIRIEDVEKLDSGYDNSGVNRGPGYGLDVAFVGAVTGIHEGRIQSTDAISCIRGIRGNLYYFKSLIRVGPLDSTTQSGDSGTMLVTTKSKGYLGLGTLVTGNDQGHYFARLPATKPTGSPLQQPLFPPTEFNPPPPGSG